MSNLPLQYPVVVVSCQKVEPMIQIYILMKKQGTSQNPISLDDEEQDKNVTEDMLQKARNQAILDEAMITGSRFDICIAVVKTSITGSIQLKARKVNKQIINYFYKTVNIKIHSAHFNKRIEPDYSDPATAPNPCVLILYGVDFLSNQMIIDRFRVVDTRMKEINWIDDSTCKLVYSTAKQTQHVLNSQLKDQVPLKIEEEDNEISRQWFVLKPYCIYSFQRPLLMRYATTREANLEKNKHNRFQEFEKAEEGLYHHLLTTFNASEQYQRVMEKVSNEKILQRSRRKSIEPRFRSRNERRRPYPNSQIDFQDHQQRRYAHDEGKFAHKNHHRHEDGRPRSTFVRQIIKTKYEHRPVDMNELSFQKINHVTGDNANRNRRSSADNNNKDSLEFSRVYYDCEEQPSMNLSFDIAKDLTLTAERNFKKQNTSDDNLDLSYVKASKNVEKEQSRDSINLNLTLKSDPRQKNNKSMNMDTSFKIAPKQHKVKEDGNLSFKLKNVNHKEYEKESDDQDLSNFLELDEEISPVQDHSNCSFKLKENIQRQLSIQVSKGNETSPHPMPTKNKKCIESILIDSDSGY